MERYHRGDIPHFSRQNIQDDAFITAVIIMGSDRLGCLAGTFTQGSLKWI
jgi:hypothetical protein